MKFQSGDIVKVGLSNMIGVVSFKYNDGPFYQVEVLLPWKWKGTWEEKAIEGFTPKSFGEL